MRKSAESIVCKQTSHFLTFALAANTSFTKLQIHYFVIINKPTMDSQQANSTGNYPQVAILESKLGQTTQQLRYKDAE